MENTIYEMTEKISKLEKELEETKQFLAATIRSNDQLRMTNQIYKQQAEIYNSMKKPECGQCQSHFSSRSYLLKHVREVHTHVPEIGEKVLLSNPWNFQINLSGYFFEIERCDGKQKIHLPEVVLPQNSQIYLINEDEPLLDNCRKITGKFVPGTVENIRIVDQLGLQLPIRLALVK